MFCTMYGFLFRAIRDVAKKIAPVDPDVRPQPLKWRRDALKALHVATEFHMIGIISKANLLALHAGRVTLKNVDMRLIQELLADP